MTVEASALWLTAPVAVPLAVAAVYAIPRGRPLTPWAGLLSPAAIVAGAIALATVVRDAGPVRAYGQLLRADALTVWLLLAVGAVALLACAANPAYLAGEQAAGRAGSRTVRRYQALVHAFLAAMCAALLAANIGVMWVAIEATTIVTAFLVGHRRTRTSIEAAWKYVVICSAGIALALLGIVLLYYAARAAHVPEAQALDWTTLLAHADRLDPAVTRLAIALVILGFGAKAGLVPLHAWLPDAHSQAPAPVSALMSGVLLAVSFTALLRCKAIADQALGVGFTRALLIGIALLTLAVAVGLLLGQQDYKRMLAYSSMEHMSLIALGAAIGTELALAAALLHIAGHGLAKTVAFCSAGQVLQLHRSTRIDRVRGVLARTPALGAAFGLAVVALLGLPPFSLFASEVALARAGFAAGLGWPTGLALLLVLAAFAALAVRTGQLLLGPAPAGPTHPVPAATTAGGPAGGPPDAPMPDSPHESAAPDTDPADPGPARTARGAGLPLGLGLLACAVLGITTGPLADLLSDAAAIVSGS